MMHRTNFLSIETSCGKRPNVAAINHNGTDEMHGIAEVGVLTGTQRYLGCLEVGNRVQIFGLIIQSLQGLLGKLLHSGCRTEEEDCVGGEGAGVRNRRRQLKPVARGDAKGLGE